MMNTQELTVDKYIRKSYKGGWCYVKGDKAKKIIKGGMTVDVNSLYPSQMHSDSGNYYPTGYPTLWVGNYIPEKAWNNHRYFFVRFRARFNLKPGFLPTIQIKGNPCYKATEWIHTSKVYNPKDGKYYESFYDDQGMIREARPLLTLSRPDYELFLQHYDVFDMTIYDGMYFTTMIGLFDDYIDHYKHIKENSTGAVRELAKLFLNNLYGKFAANTDSSFKVLEKGEFGNLIARIEPENKKAPGYIPIGSAVTSYARCFTIRAAQKNYDRFIYADTDSLHLEGSAKPKGIKIHDTDFNAWKIENTFHTGFYVRQKTYIEVTNDEKYIKDNGHPYIIKCAGMPQRCKDLLIKSFQGEHTIDHMTADEEEFLKVKRSIEDFNIGLKVPSKLRPVQIAGGIILVPTTYEMRP